MSVLIHRHTSDQLLLPRPPPPSPKQSSLSSTNNNAPSDVLANVENILLAISRNNSKTKATNMRSDSINECFQENDENRENIDQIITCVPSEDKDAYIINDEFPNTNDIFTNFHDSIQEQKKKRHDACLRKLQEAELTFKELYRTRLASIKANKNTPKEVVTILLEDLAFVYRTNMNRLHSQLQKELTSIE
eukprot:m.341075 g.341075  ORF g.341075 m.341075 type:complete len:191 (-) comp19789_c0_seq1:158-730(-)